MICSSICLRSAILATRLQCIFTITWRSAHRHALCKQEAIVSPSAREPSSFQAPSASLSTSGNGAVIRTLDEELLLRKTRHEKAWDSAAALLHSNPGLLLHYDCLLQKFSSALRLTHAQLEEGGDVVVEASQLEPIDTGFGRSTVRVKPLLEKKGRRTRRKENCPPIAPALQAVGKSKGRSTFRETLSQGVSQSR